MEDIDPYKSQEDIEQSLTDQEKYRAANTNTDGRERAIGGSWKKTPYGDFKVKDCVLIRHHKEIYGYFGGLQSRIGWDRPFTIKRSNKTRNCDMGLSQVVYIC